MQLKQCNSINPPNRLSKRPITFCCGIYQQVYVPYKPQRIKVAQLSRFDDDGVLLEGISQVSLKPHPTQMIESASFRAVQPPLPSYHPALVPAVIANGWLSDIQYESVVYAGMRHSQMLGNGSQRAAYFIGDGTGAGKGRQIAGIILDNWNRGRRRSVWVSKGRAMLHGCRRDLDDLGAQCIPIMSMPQRLKTLATFSEGVVYCTYRFLTKRTSAVCLKGHTYVMMNYSLPPLLCLSCASPLVGIHWGCMTCFPNDNICTTCHARKSYPKVMALADWVRGSATATHMAKGDGVVVLDECHAAKTATSHTAYGISLLQHSVPNARLVYSSATGASSLKHLSCLFRLGLWGEGEDLTTFDQFVSFLGRGILPEHVVALRKNGPQRKLGGRLERLELLALEMKARGMYCSRTVSWRGTEFEMRSTGSTPTVVALYNRCVTLWTAILDWIMACNESRTRKDGRLALNFYWSAHQRFFKQLLMSAKVMWGLLLNF